MNFDAFRRHSLKTRVTLLSLAIFVISIWALAYYAGLVLRDSMQRLLSEQQFSTASIVAAQISGEIDDRLRGLETYASGRLTPDILGNAAAIQKRLEQSPTIQIMFNAGLYVTDANGTAIAEIPTSTHRVGLNYLERDHIVAALKEGRTTVSEPVVGKVRGNQIVSMTTPIRDAQGHVAGALVGVTDLGKPNFLDHLTQIPYGKTGSFLLIAPQHRLIVTSNDKLRVMEALPAPGISPALDRFTKGYEGTQIFTNPLGVEVIASVKKVPAAGWQIAVLLPTADAFAPIQDIQNRLLLGAILVAVLAGILNWWLLKRQLAPLTTAVKTLATMSNSNQAPQQLPIVRRDEVGELIAGFNLLVGTLTQRETALRKSEKLLREAQKAANIGCHISDLEAGTFESTSTLDEIFGITKDYPHTSEAWVKLMHPDFMQVMHDSIVDSIKNKKPLNVEYSIIRPSDGIERWMHGLGQVAYDDTGRAVSLIGTVQDITERKRVNDRLYQSEQDLRQAQRIAKMGSYVLDIPSGRWETNEVVDNLFGIDQTLEHSVQSGEALIHPDDLAIVSQYLSDQVEAKEQTFNIEYRIRRHDDKTEQWIHCIGQIEFDEQGQAQTMRGTIQDISERKAAELALRKLSLVVEQSAESTVITNLQAQIEYVNEACLLNSGYSRDDLLGQNPRILQSGRTPRSTYVDMWAALTQGQSWKGEFCNRRKDGSEYTELATITPLRQSNGQITHYVAVKEDITHRKAADEEIQRLAFFDSLTNLPNRRLLLDRLQQALTAASRHQHQGALLLVDLDNFKDLNDALGHGQGDLVLQEVAKRLGACIGEEDTVARLGADEFVVLLAQLEQDSLEAALLAEIAGNRILDALQQRSNVIGSEMPCTASIGVTLFGVQHEETVELLKRAELAMFQAKAQGRNTLRFFDPKMQAVVSARVSMEASLREAVGNNQLLLHYQPQVTIKGHITGVEALLRWQHPKRGMVSPAEFIPVAEETGLILSIGDWVMQTACKQLAHWADQPGMAHLTVAVNVSARQFHQRDFVDLVLSTLYRTRANPTRLKLELTESVMVANVEEVISKMSALKGRGVGFSLDDFGTGYSSLSYLKRLPLDQLKIDQGFVRDILIDANDAAIAKMVVALAESMGLNVIAEGVEIEGQRDFLAAMGCHNYQGYLFSRPLPVQEFETFVQKG